MSDEFRKVAISLTGAAEVGHMGHPDFRVCGNVFASLGYPDAGCGMVNLTPEERQCSWPATRLSSGRRTALGAQGQHARTSYRGSKDYCSRCGGNGQGKCSIHNATHRTVAAEFRSLRTRKIAVMV